MSLYDIIYLIGSHLAVSDGEINSKEHTLLAELCHPSEYALAQQALIYSDAPDKFALDDLIMKYREQACGDNSILFRVLHQVAEADDYVAPQEAVLIMRVAEILGVSEDEVLAFRPKRESHEKGVMAEVKLTWADTLTAAFKSLVVELRAGDMADGYDELLSGFAFKKKIKDIAKVAQEDLEIAEEIMSGYNAEISVESDRIAQNIDTLKQIQRKDKEIEALVEAVVDTNDWIRGELKTAMEDNLEVLNKKKKNINYFTIAFMGRTKAGKSTFHKVVTHEENDDIGVGKLRTTRYNRSFYWENVRIVDTPGIGAPGGMTDTETAASIIDEADLVCYVVTDDSIQVTEFDFLRPLKERSKPLFIILNVKGDLDHPKRLEKFIRDPLKWKREEGNKDIKGHFERINEALGDKYDMSMVEIIPLQLYAAILADQKDRFSEEERNALVQGSNIQEYVHKVKKAIYRTGSMKKTQNIYDGCAYQMYQLSSEMRVRHEKILKDIKSVDESLEKLSRFIDKEKESVTKKVIDAISGAYASYRNNTDEFALKYYDQKKTLTDEWNKFPANVLTAEKLTNNLTKIFSDFKENVEERVKEYLHDIDFQQGFHDINQEGEIKGKKIRNHKFTAKIIGTLVTAAVPLYAKSALVLLGFSNPVGWVITAFVAGVGLIVSGIVALFKSKEKKQKEAQEKLKNTIIKNLDENEQTRKEELTKECEMRIDEIKTKLINSFGFASEQSKNIAERMKSLIALSESNQEYMECMFAYRILQYLRVTDKVKDGQDVRDIAKQNVSAERFYESASMHISRPADIPSDLLDLASLVTQIKITN